MQVVETPRNICAIIISEASSEEEAKKLSAMKRNCPYLIVTGTDSNKICSAYIVPEDKKWWVKYPETNPKATGVQKASTYIVEKLHYPFEPKSFKTRSDIAPCGADCRSCTLREEYSCAGCPATVHYNQK